MKLRMEQKDTAEAIKTKLASQLSEADFDQLTMQAEERMI